jgi:single CXXC unit
MVFTMARSAVSLAAEQRFRARVAELGATVAGEYIGSLKPVACICAKGHRCQPRPADVQQGKGLCRTCAGRDPAAAEAAFRARIARMGGTVTGEYVNVGVPVACICVNGHACNPRPNDVRQGDGICRTCAGNDPAAAEAAFRQRLLELGATLLEPQWLGSGAPHRVRCAEGHECQPRPGDVRQGHGICLACVKRDPVTAEAAFRQRIAELGATLLGPYADNKTRILARCAGGHECWVLPNSVQQGRGICRVCAGLDPATSEAAFRAHLAELGATILGPYVNSATPIPARCAAGHECRPIPAQVQQGKGICLTCAGLDPKVAEAAFRARVAELGGTMLGSYVNNRAPVLVRCAAGHECRPRPSGVLYGDQGFCGTCAGNDRDVAEAAFRERLDALGATLLGTYVNSGTPVLVLCAAGHRCEPRPNSVQRGQGVCVVCAGNDRAAGELAFCTRVAELGGMVLGEYVNNHTPVLVRCPGGHLGRPHPHGIMTGQGICRICSCKAQDVFYVVTSRLAVKFGITSGNPRPRLATHARQGYKQVVRLVADLAPTVAAKAERAVLSALAMAGEQPIRGKEYFDISCLALILDVADSWLDCPEDIQATA